MSNHPPGSVFNTFENQIRHQVRAMFFSSFLHKKIQGYVEDIYTESYFEGCSEEGGYIFSIRLQTLRDCWFHQMDELSTIMACEIVKKIAYTSVAPNVFKEDSAIKVIIHEHDLVIQIT